MIHFVFKPEEYNPKIRMDLVEDQRILIMPIGDVHFGSPGWPEKKFKKHLEWGMNRGAYFLGMGEYLDSFSHSQRALLTGAVRDSTRSTLDKTIRSQAEELLDLLIPTTGRWIGMLEGDHRWDFQDGTSVDQMIAAELETHFLGTSALIRIKMLNLDDHPEGDCILYCHHGVGAAQMQGGSLNKVENMLKAIDADIYLMGHSHAKVAAPIDQQTITPDGVHTHRTKLIARTGAWLSAYSSSTPNAPFAPAIHSRGTYVEKGALIPSGMGGLAIGISSEKIKGSSYYRPLIHASL